MVTITPDAGVRELIALLAEHNVGALIVSTDGETVDGIVSERDVVRHLHSDGTVVNNTVSAIMTEVVETCEPDSLARRPDGDHDRRAGSATSRSSPTASLVGIISIGDVVKHKIEPAGVRARPARLLRPPDLTDRCTLVTGGTRGIGAASRAHAWRARATTWCSATAADDAAAELTRAAGRGRRRRLPAGPAGPARAGRRRVSCSRRRPLTPPRPASSNNAGATCTVGTLADEPHRTSSVGPST